MHLWLSEHSVSLTAVSSALAASTKMHAALTNSQAVHAGANSR
jgi:hypothetical protein